MKHHHTEAPGDTTIWTGINRKIKSPFGTHELSFCERHKKSFEFVWFSCHTATVSSQWPCYIKNPKISTFRCQIPHLLPNFHSSSSYTFILMSYILYVLLNALSRLYFTLLTAWCWRNVWCERWEVRSELDAHTSTGWLPPVHKLQHQSSRWLLGY